jgi:hypothetical protein
VTISDRNTQKGRRCATCRFFVKDESACHKSAPQLVVIQDRDHNLTKLTLWPPVPINQWCDDWKIVLTIDT